MGNENSILSKEEILHVEGHDHTLSEMASMMGAEGNYAQWKAVGLDITLATLFAGAQADLEGAEAISKVVGADLRARVLRNDCAGDFETVEDEVALRLSVAMQRLNFHALESLESIRMEMCARKKADN